MRPKVFNTFVIGSFTDFEGVPTHHGVNAAPNRLAWCRLGTRVAVTGARFLDIPGSRSGGGVEEAEHRHNKKESHISGPF